MKTHRLTTTEQLYKSQCCDPSLLPINEESLVEGGEIIAISGTAANETAKHPLSIPAYNHIEAGENLHSPPWIMRQNKQHALI